MPPLVKTTSPGSQFRTWATDSRAASMARSAACPNVCTASELPNVSAKYGSIASRASAARGVVAL